MLHWSITASVGATLMSIRGVRARGAGGGMAPCMAGGRVWAYSSRTLFVSVGTDSKTAPVQICGRIHSSHHEDHRACSTGNCRSVCRRL
ncbi:hypothetical protein BJV74DRAFT_861020 [Russula compacta]|nr:hypothetical protein BJV74DRAFT_861020 [Russula compacta]